MKIKKGYDNKHYFVFEDEDAAYKWEWLFCDVLGCGYRSFGQYMNAFNFPFGV